ncbi:hypothetical protein LCGC14_2914150 [marine sediment metagenome]|uniref:Uncharacterized protein n=1 Tax=marine sediment metagenome TaxID=412755 RepID=A0A0F8XR46_9ZZZZ
MDTLIFSAFDEPVPSVTGETLLKRKATLNYDITGGNKDFLFDFRFMGRITYIFVKCSNFAGSPNSTIELFRNNDVIPQTGADIDDFVAVPDTLKTIPVAASVCVDNNIIDYGWDRMVISIVRNASTTGIINEILVTMKDFS